MNVSGTNQTNYLSAYQKQENKGLGKKLNTILQSVPPKEQADIKSLLDTLDPSGKKDALKKMAELDRSNLNVEDLVKAINEIFQSSQTTKTSSFPSSFSMYA
ncbi:MAG: hypothetical protein COB17_01850 [Sulfurimonas sp.]|nr:MAG: hypothetical protein COB17_01850 [Sulfurimonas sp.]